MVRLMLDNGKVIKKVFNSSDEARRWYSKNKKNYDDVPAGVITETKYKKLSK